MHGEILLKIKLISATVWDDPEDELRHLNATILQEYFRIREIVLNNNYRSVISEVFLYHIKTLETE